MKNYYLFLFIFCFLVMGNAFAQRKTPEQMRVDSILKETRNFSKDYLIFSSIDDKGNPVSSHSLKGFNVFYVFGNSQCPPCLGLAKTIKAIVDERRYEGRNIRFAFVTNDDKKGISRLLKIHKLNFDYIISMSTSQMQQTGLIYIVKPTYILVDKNGKVVFKNIGFPDDLKTAKEVFEKQIAPEINRLLEDTN